MNWFEGDITEAVALSKSRNAIFVVYIERKGEEPCKMAKLLDDSKVRKALGTEDFVCIKIEGDSETYLQFARIYQIVPIPAIFFIGKAGTPLEIATSVLENADQLMVKIRNVLELAGKAPVKAEVQEKPVSAMEPEQNVTAASDSGPASTAAIEKENTAETSPTSAPAAVQATAAAAPATAEADESRLSWEKSRLERIEKREKELEARRRQEPKEPPNLVAWQKEQEIKELQETMKRERIEERQARDRILAQIAADKAERAQKFAPDRNNPSTSAAANPQNRSPQAQAAGETRLQFRFASGDNKTHTFKCSATLGEVQFYVASELLAGTGITEFTLATTYPKQEFTIEHYEQTLEDLNLFPSAVILVIGKEARGPSAMIAKQGGLFNIFSMIIMSIFRPILGVLQSAQNWITGSGGGNRNSNAAKADAHKRTLSDRGVQDDVSKRRNMDRLFTDTNNAAMQQETSRGAYRRYVSGTNVHRLQDTKDSDDENATWNGNSTQQQ